MSFTVALDPLGTALTSGKSTEDPFGHEDTKRPSLTKVVLSLPTPAKQQEALGHIQTALQIAYARDAIVNSLGGVALAAQERKEDMESQQGVSVEITGIIPPSPTTTMTRPPCFGGKLDDEAGALSRTTSCIPSGLDDFTSLLTIEDARVLVDLLKLAVAKRVGPKGKETLGAVLTAMGKANPEVMSIIIIITC